MNEFDKLRRLMLYSDLDTVDTVRLTGIIASMEKILKFIEEYIYDHTKQWHN